MGKALKCPMVGQYLEAIGNPEGLFRTLRDAVPETDACGRPLFTAGNYSVIFKMRDRAGNHFALKCYTRMSGYPEEVYAALGAGLSPYLVPCRFLPGELFLFGEQDEDDGSYYPVVWMEWVDGEPLGGCLARLCREDDRSALESLAIRFDRLATWLLAQEFAHGDLKQDNLIVAPDGTLRLVDYDGAFVPALAGRPGVMFGSPAYQHPSRDARFFNRAVDDYPAALISFSLHALAVEPSLFFGYNDGENIIFDAAEVQRGRSRLFARTMERWSLEGRNALVSLGHLLLSSSPALPGLPGLLSELGGEPEELPSRLRIVDDEDPHMAVFTEGGLFGYADLIRRHIVLRAIYRDAAPFREGMAVVRCGDHYRMIDRTGRCRIDCRRYRSVGPFSDARALVFRDGLYGFIDPQGREAIVPRYEFATGFRDGLAVVRIGDKYGYIDVSGRLAIEPVYDYAGRFSDGKARVESGEKSFFIYKTDEKKVGSVENSYL